MKKIFILFLLFLVIFLNHCDKNMLGIKEPIFEVDKKSDNEYEVKITAGNNAAIFYTTDGSEPTNQDKRYTEKIKVKKGTKIKAIAICPSGRKSIVTETTP